LTAEQEEALSEIQNRKHDLIFEISILKDRLACVQEKVETIEKEMHEKEKVETEKVQELEKEKSERFHFHFHFLIDYFPFQFLISFFYY